MTDTINNALRNGRLAQIRFGMWFPRVRAAATATPIMVRIDGRLERALNAYRAGPDAPIHTYDIAGQRTVREIGGQWRISSHGLPWNPEFNTCERTAQVEAA